MWYIFSLSIYYDNRTLLNCDLLLPAHQKETQRRSRGPTLAT